MKISAKTEIKLEGQDKCICICDSDCSLGQLYDFSCAFHSLIVQKMKEVEEQKSQQVPQQSEQTAE